MKKIIKLLGILIIGLAVVGCASNNDEDWPIIPPMEPYPAPLSTNSVVK